MNKNVNPYSVESLPEEALPSNRWLPLIFAGFVLFMIGIVWLPAIIDPDGNRVLLISLLQAELVQGIVSRLLMLLVLLFSIVSGWRQFVSSFTAKSNAVIQRSVAAGWIINGMAIAIWLGSDVVSGFSTVPQDASLYARGFMVTLIVSPLLAAVFLWPIFASAQVFSVVWQRRWLRRQPNASGEDV